MGLEKDENPFLGYRAIRFCLDRKEDIYKPQLRALLRASAFGNIRIMVPLVTCIEEYREARGLVEELKAELDEAGIAYKKDIQVGIMVETAAASLIDHSSIRPRGLVICRTRNQINAMAAASDSA